jgi:hypothetical protein
MRAAIIILGLLLASCRPLGTDNTLYSASSPQDAVIPLFNGKNLDGLHTWLVDSKREDPRHVFTVQDGMIRITGDGFGYLSTNRAYKDYRLVVEFKWGRRNFQGREKNARDSGLFLHSAGPDGNSFDARGAFKAAIECQIMEGSVGDLLLIKGKSADGKAIPVRLTAEIADQRDRDGWAWWKTGGQSVVFDKGGRINWFAKDPDWTDTLGFRGKRDIESPLGEWTRIECICDRDRISVYVNGVLVNQARDVYPNSGPILLQCEGSEVFFRKFELHAINIETGR